MPGGVEVVAQSRSGTWLDALEQCPVTFFVTFDIDLLVGALEEHPIARFETNQVDLLPGGCPEQVEEVVEHLGHQPPRRPGVETESLMLPGAGTATEIIVLLDQFDVVAVMGQQGSGGQPRNTTADDDYSFRWCGHLKLFSVSMS